MSDLGLSVALSRTVLGLADLQINDHINYYISGSQFLGGNVQWQRNQITSPFADGAVTVTRNRQMVTEQIVIEVLGTSQTVLQNNLNALVTAMVQDNFTLTTALNDGVSTATYQYLCEAADYQIAWNGPRFIAHQLQVTFALPRQPVPLQGV